MKIKTTPKIYFPFIYIVIDIHYKLNLFLIKNNFTKDNFYF